MQLRNIITIIAMGIITIPALGQSLKSGIPLENLDRSCTPGEDFYQFACGGWVKNNPLPAAYSRSGSFDRLQQDNNERINGILTELLKNQYAVGTVEQKLSDFYKLAMDSTRRNAEGVKPVMPFIKEINDTLKAYQYSKRCNVLRVAYEACRWAKRGATINSISPGIIITPLANDELHGPRAKGYLDMIAGMPARRAGTPDEVGDLAEVLMSSRGRFISGADFLIDGGCTASYWYGDLQYLKATH